MVRHRLTAGVAPQVGLRVTGDKFRHRYHSIQLMLESASGTVKKG